ncbi:MAG: small ribosomal subunit Rsm22 family protein [Halanaeroarchaeum sp.]
MPVDRDAVRDAAKYLRSVRPIDPAEIREYVPDRPDSRAVRQVLRELSLELGLVERPDGTFAPVTEGTLSVDLDAVEGLPDRYIRVVEDRLADRFGPRWSEGESADRLREIIRRFKADYYRQHPVEYDRDVALGYAVYHLPVYYASAQWVLWDLVRDGLLDRTLRVLDVGAGVGGPALGIHDLLFDDGADPPLVEYHALEPSEATTLLEPLLETTAGNFHWTVHEERAEGFDPPGPFDVVLFSNVLSELDDPVAVADRYIDVLADDGTFVGIAPADRATSIHLREVERALEDRGRTVYGPTVRLWPDRRPTDEGWSFDQRPDVESPSFQQRLAQGADRPAEFTHTSVKFSYTFLRTDGRRRFDVDLTDRPVVPLADAERHVTDRVDVVVAKLSRNLSEGEHPLYKVSDGSEAVDHFAVLVNETELNRPLREAEYGDLLSIERGLLLWNDDEAAYNLVVDQDAIVDPA